MCHFHSRDMKDFGLASAFFRILQVSQAKFFSVEGVNSVFMAYSFHDWILLKITFEVIIHLAVPEHIG